MIQCTNLPHKHTLIFVDTGLDVYLSLESHLQKIKEIYNKINIDIETYPSDINIEIQNNYKEQLFKTFININSTFDPKLSLKKCIDILKSDISLYIQKQEKVNYITECINRISLKYNSISKKQETKNNEPIITLFESINEHITCNIWDNIHKKNVDNIMSNKPPPIILSERISNLHSFEPIQFAEIKSVNKIIFEKINFDIIRNHVLYIKSINTVVVMNDEYDFLSLSKDFSDIIYIGEIDNNSANVFHKQSFNDLKSFNRMFNHVKNTTKNQKTLETNNNFNVLKEYITTTYNVTENESQRVKSSILYNEFIKNVKENSSIKDDVTFSIQWFSNGLHKIGLKKKRYSDGFYYYGLSLVHTAFINSKININDIYEKSIKERSDGLCI